MRTPSDYENLETLLLFTRIALFNAVVVQNGIDTILSIPLLSNEITADTDRFCI
jgi:hypothetical protein